MPNLTGIYLHMHDRRTELTRQILEQSYTFIRGVAAGRTPYTWDLMGKLQPVTNFSLLRRAVRGTLRTEE